MKEVLVSSSTAPAKPRSEKYSGTVSVAYSTRGSSGTGGTGGSGSSVDIVKVGDTKSFTDANVLSSLRSLAEFISRNDNSEVKAIVDYLNGIKINGNHIAKLLLKDTQTDKVTDTDIMSALRVLSEMESNNEELKKIFLSSIDEDTAAELITFAKGIVSKDRITTLNLLVQELAGIYDLDVSHIATMFRTIVKDYISSEQYVPGLTGNGMKLYKALNGDWNIELDNATIRKGMTIFELIISKIRAVNGGLVISSANGRIKSVAEEGDFYKIGIEGDMMFTTDDLIRCQVFTSNQYKYYWVAVSRVENGYMYTLKSEFSEGVVPGEGDDLVHFGNRTNVTRQGVLYLTASEDGKPRFSVLDGVNSTDLTGKSKVILGSLDGITDTDFPADLQPSGYGLYAMNVFMKGLFILRNGKSVDSEIESARGYAQQQAGEAMQGAINDAALKYATQTQFGILDGKIEGKVSNESFNALGARVGTAESTISQQSGLITSKVSQTDFNALDNTVSSQGTEIEQSKNQISLVVTASNNARILALAMSGKMLYRDPVFAYGNNGINIYNNNGNGMVNIYREWTDGCPNTSGYALKIVSQGSAEPGSGGFFFGTITKANAVLVTRFIAKIPSGYDVEWTSNPTGDGGYREWLTDQSGTGNWKEYACIVRCGSGGWFSSTNFFYITNGGAVTWYLAYATVFDATGMDDTPTKDEIKSGITVSPGAINIFGQDISLYGAVTFSSMSSDAQDKINSAQGTANTAVGKADSAQGSADTANSGLNTLNGRLGSLAFDNAVSFAKLDSTIVEGGYIRTNLVNAHLIVTNGLAAGMITTGNLIVTDGARIGGFAISGDSLSSGQMTIDPYNIQFSANGISAGFGVDTAPSALGLRVPLWIDNRVSSDTCIAAFLSASGAWQEGKNHALSIKQGNIRGFRLAAQRVNATRYLDAMDSIIFVTANITLYLPADAEDGQMYFINSYSSYTIRPGMNCSLYMKNGSVSEDRPSAGSLHIYMFDKANSRWLMSWMN